MKKGHKIPAPAAVPTMSQQDVFLDSLYGEDLVLARATGCTCQADLDREKEKKQEREQKAYNSQRAALRENERKRQWEKEQEKKQREKDREDNKWKKQLETAKKLAFTQGVLEAEDYGDGVYWVQCEDKKWLEVAGQYYCTLCNKQLNDNSLEMHIQSEAHRKKVAWYSSTPTSCLPAPAVASAVAVLAVTAVVKRETTLALPEWQQMCQDGLVRCIPCNKVVDDNHITSGDHIRRFQAWQEHEQRKRTGYAPPALEYLAWMPSVAGDDNSERWMRCLLCQKWVNDDSSHIGTQANPQGSAQHQKNLRNHVGTAWYKENVLKERLKWHPEPAQVRSAPAGPTTRAPWGRAAAPTAPTPPTAPTYHQPPAPAGPDWLTEPLPGDPRPPDCWDDPWNAEEAKPKQAPYAAATRLPSADPGEVEEEFDC